MTCWPWVGWEAHSPDLLFKSPSRYASAAPSEHASWGGGEVKSDWLLNHKRSKSLLTLWCMMPLKWLLKFKTVLLMSWGVYFAHRWGMKVWIFSWPAQCWLGLQAVWEQDGEVTWKGLKHLCDKSSERVNLVRVGLSIFTPCLMIRQKAYEQTLMLLLYY